MVNKLIISAFLVTISLVVACKNEPKTNADTATQTTMEIPPSVDSAALAAQAKATPDSIASAEKAAEKAAAEAAMAQTATEQKAKTTAVKKGNTPVAVPAKPKTKPKITPITPVKPSTTTTIIKPDPKFDDGNIVKRPGRDDVFTISEVTPTYPGGEKEMMKYLQKNIKYPNEAKEKGIKGTVFVEFVVEKDGTVDDVLVKKGVNPLLDKEAVRVVNSMPKWAPGKQNGNLVAVRYTLPVKFDLIN